MCLLHANFSIFQHLEHFSPFAFLTKTLTSATSFSLNNLSLVIIGGSLGNLFDRIYYYAVPDFIDLHFGNFHWFVFNIADISISLGIIGLIVIEISKKKNV